MSLFYYLEVSLISRLPTHFHYCANHCDFDKIHSQSHPSLIVFLSIAGDRVLTDVVFANQYGMLSVLVAPLSLSKDHPIAVIIR